MSYSGPMHEVALAENLLEMAGQEMRRRGLKKLLSLRVRCGALAGVMPEALEFAFAALLRERAAGPDGAFAHARLEIVRETLRLLCAGCGREFTPARHSLFAGCPACGYEFFHQALGGAEILFDRMEAE